MLHLRIDSTEIFTEYAGGKQLDSAYKEDGKHNAGHSRYISRRMAEDFKADNAVQKEENEAGERQQGRYQSENKYRGQRFGGKIKDSIKAQPYKLSEQPTLSGPGRMLV